MKNSLSKSRKSTLDKDLDKFVVVEEATASLAQGLVAPGLALLFLALAAIIASFFVIGEPRGVIIVAAAAIGAYMALNIGANDVANNVGPAVGAKALTMGGALIIAAIFESAGALIAGGDVMTTIASGIVDPAQISDPNVFIRLMLAALISSALWVNLATIIGAPVSTTHAVVGGILGAGASAVGVSSINWGIMGGIAASWVISPLMGGAIAAAFLAFLKVFVIYQDDKITAARLWVPILIAIMGGAFTAYLATKGLRQVLDLSGFQIAAMGAATFVIVWGISHISVRRQSEGMENRNQSLRTLFKLPLICSAAILSFAHGANDVANAVAPLAAIVQVAHGDLASGTTIPIPFWVMLIGALGISIGLLLFGPKLIRMVGEQITKLNPMRAFCVALSAAITVIVASWLGMPISSTHTAVGAVFGVGFFREWYTSSSTRRRAYLRRMNASNRAPVDEVPASGEINVDDEQFFASREEIARRKLVRRAHVTTIVAAWITTVPASALLAAAVFFVLGVFA